MTWPNYNWPRVKNNFAKPPLKCLIDCNNESLEASAVRIKEDVKENEGNNRIDLIIKVSKNKLICFVFEYRHSFNNVQTICSMQRRRSTRLITPSKPYI
ncbi:hypothetical protein H5410_004414 [Solanum commersonii]|uniref:Uncharacterized protein n=1 Tax=Solanum commersonii TaxID=4109 RepID=A0A9J6B7Q3_SOLCO|nr:hypothetical protein H5410_004414 [Solanum commersonii]